MTGEAVHDWVDTALGGVADQYALRLPGRIEAVLHEEVELFNRHVLALGPLVELEAKLSEVAHRLLESVLVIHFNEQHQLRVAAKGRGDFKFHLEILLLAADIDEELLDLVVDLLSLRLDAIKVVLVGISFPRDHTDFKIWVPLHLTRHERVDVVSVEHEELQEFARQEPLRLFTLGLSPPRGVLRTVHLSE